jgi:epoxyqueuosine reductase
MKISSILDNEFLDQLGVVDWGYTTAPVPHSLHHYENWVDSAAHQPLNYLSDHRRHLRRDLRNVFPEFKSALVFLFSYRPTKRWMLDQGQHGVASYALGFEGEDYHRTLKDRLTIIREHHFPDAKTFFYSIDAQPILERDLAFRAGLGWFGKNSMLINRREGSYFIIASLLLDRELPIEETQTDVDHCGTCMACIESCPTNAINPETRTLVASSCISTFTIELFKDAPAPEGMENSRGEIFGCDICQDVCPWNNKPLQRTTGKLTLKPSYDFLKSWFYEWPKEKLKDFVLSQTNRGLKKKLFGTPFDRPGREGWLKNLKTYFQPK